MPSPILTDQQVVTDKRAALLDAALELFTTGTYAGTPVPSIAARAGVGAGTVYRQFASKEALANAVYQREKAAMLELLAVPRRPGVSAREEFAQWWQGLWRYAAQRPAGLAFLETHHHEAYLDTTSRALSAEVGNAAAAVLRRGQRARAVRRGPPDLLVALAFGAFVGLQKSGAPATLRLITLTEHAVWAMLARPEGR